MNFSYTTDTSYFFKNDNRMIRNFCLKDLPFVVAVDLLLAMAMVD